MCEHEAVNSKAERRLGWKSSSPPDLPPSFSDECLSAAEEAAEQVLNCVQPTLDSEEERRDIIDYVRRLIKNRLNCEVFPYGSVPLKAYLPDGDIDLTVLEGPKAEASFAHDVFAVLKGEEKNENAEYQVKDTLFINAEVKLVKCLVHNIVVDVSFNQLGGLSTLCFLEQIDRVIGRNHLFKRSIILVKAWCYYESRILGAHHGLISTYALETLILYIFHLFHSSLGGPLAVLYKFLEYYCQFDWENYCISLNGPVYRSTLPDIVVKMPESGCNDLMLRGGFLENCMEVFSVPSRWLEGNLKAFQAKHLNIIDPLKENNNLGRSVHRGNFYRIRSAFKYGAHKLRHVLLQPKDKAADGISEFFKNTLDRNGHKYRSNIEGLTLEHGGEDSFRAPLSSQTDLISEDDKLQKSSVSDFDNDSIGVGSKDEIETDSVRKISSEMASEPCYPAEGIVLSGNHMAEEAYDLETYNSNFRSGMSGYTSRRNCCPSFSGNRCCEPLYFTSKSCAEDGSIETWNSYKSNLSDTSSQKFCPRSSLQEGVIHGEMNNTYGWCVDNSQSHCRTGFNFIRNTNVLGNLSLDFREMDLSSVGEWDPSNPLADLTGDYDSHIRSLLFGQLCNEFSLCSSVVHHSSSLPSRISKKNSWDIVCQSIPFLPRHFSRMSPYAVPTEQCMSLATDPPLAAYVFHPEGMHPPKARGTGTYFPHRGGVYMEKPSRGRLRNKPQGNFNRFRRYGRSNSLYPAPGDLNAYHFENATREVLPARSRSQGLGRLDLQCRSPTSVGDENQDSGNLNESNRIEFGTVGNLGEEVISASVHVKSPTSLEERVAGPTIHLTNEDEFPPLCN